jgi:hypothetical protein
MARPQTIFIDRDKLLANLCRLWEASLRNVEGPIADATAALEQAAAESAAAYEASRPNPFDPDIRERAMAAARRHREARERLSFCEKRRDELVGAGLPYDLHALAGTHDLSPSERLRTNQALRSMEAEGLLDIYGVRATAIWPTEAGLAKARELTSQPSSNTVHEVTVRPVVTSEQSAGGPNA